jgi:hypothetical protein
VRVGAGLRLRNLCGLAAKAGLAGFEFLEGIPGNVGGALRVMPPAGEREPLRVSATIAVPGVSWGPGRTLGSLHPGDVDSTDLRVEVSRPALLRLEVTTEGGATVLVRELGLVEQGRHEVRWVHDSGLAPRVPAGRYLARLVATDSTGAEAGEAARPVVLR